MSLTNADPRIAFFDHHAPRWDEFGPPIAQVLARLEALRPALRLAAGRDVLEVGCGTGRVTAWLADLVRPGRVMAIDFSAAMIERARARGIDADFRQADVCADDLGTARFDIVFCMHAFPHFRDPADALRRLAAALRPGGTLVVLHLIGREKVNAIHAHAGAAIAGDHLPPADAWPGLLADAGLVPEELTDREDLFLVVAHRA